MKPKFSILGIVFLLAVILTAGACEEVERPRTAFDDYVEMFDYYVQETGNVDYARSLPIGNAEEAKNAVASMKAALQLYRDYVKYVRLYAAETGDVIGAQMCPDPGALNPEQLQYYNSQLVAAISQHRAMRFNFNGGYRY